MTSGASSITAKSTSAGALTCSQGRPGGRPPRGAWSCRAPRGQDAQMVAMPGQVHGLAGFRLAAVRCCGARRAAGRAAFPPSVAIGHRGRPSRSPCPKRAASVAAPFDPLGAQRQIDRARAPIGRPDHAGAARRRSQRRATGAAGTIGRAGVALAEERRRRRRFSADRRPRRARPPGCSRPRCITAIRSLSAIASDWSWVTSTVVTPASCWMRRSSSCISSRSLASRFDSGSSSSSSSGLMTSARASATRWRWPPDIARGYRSARWERWTRSSASADAPLALGPADLPHFQSEADIFGDRHVREQRIGLENDPKAALARRDSAQLTTIQRDRPPEVVSSKPAIICSVVVLPQPDGPSSETNSPRSTRKREAIDRDGLAEALGQTDEFQNCHCRSAPEGSLHGIAAQPPRRISKQTISARLRAPSAGSSLGGSG